MYGLRSYIAHLMPWPTLHAIGFRDIEIWGVWAPPAAPKTTPQEWKRRPITFWNGFRFCRGRPDPKNQRLPAGPKPCINGPSVRLHGSLLGQPLQLCRRCRLGTRRAWRPSRKGSARAGGSRDSGLPGWAVAAKLGPETRSSWSGSMVRNAPKIGSGDQ